jgi:hypothetical protein
VLVFVYPDERRGRISEGIEPCYIAHASLPALSGSFMKRAIGQRDQEILESS